jgi:hypothetical protein
MLRLIGPVRGVRACRQSRRADPARDGWLLALSVLLIAATVWLARRRAA